MPDTPQTLTGQDIGEAEGAVRALLEHVLDGTGVTADEYVILRVLTFRGSWPSRDALRDFLAAQRQLRLSPSAAEALLAGLESRGLITGTSISPAGASRHTDLATRVTAATRDLYGPLDPADLATAHRVLTEVVTRADHLRRAGYS